MDYPEQQQKFLAEFQSYFDGLVLNEGLINSVKDFFPVLWIKNKVKIQFNFDQIVSGYINDLF